MKEKLRDFIKNKKVLSYLIIIFVSIFVCIPLCSKYADISTDDGIQHIYRLLGTFSSLQEGNLFPVIMSEFCNEFGYSWNIFYSPLTAYLPLIFKIFTNSFVLCLKLFIFTTILLSGIYMYKLVFRITKSHKASIISAILYISAPYHLTDIYNRVAIAELATFTFLPIVFIGMYDLFKENKKSYYLSFGAIGLTLTHNVLTVYTAIFCLIYMIINYKKINKNIIKTVLINVLIILLCTSFYWIPLLEHYFATTYEVFIPERMYNLNTLIESKLSTMDLLFGRKWGINLYLGLPLILGIIFTFIYRKKISYKIKTYVAIFLSFGIASLIMTLSIFPFEYLPSFLRMLQFVWRMLIFASFFLSIISGITINMFIDKNNKKKAIFAIIFVVYLVVVVNSSKQMIKIPFDEEKYLKPRPVSSQTLKVHAGCATFEYLPKKAYSNLDYIKTRNSNVIIISGEAEIINENKSGTKMTFEVNNIKDNVTIELPYIYYLGYNATITDEKGNVTKLKIKESENGFCMIDVKAIESGTINISYDGTMLMKVSYVSTLAGIIILIGIVCKNRHNVVK
ncbi:MAG: hypothetical protein HFJ58_05645 [Clostridia bacterium]|nr:hypothetical protein [Clostridia bacterium]